MAAPAPARKPPEAAGNPISKLAAWFLSQLGSWGFTATPAMLSKRLYRCCEKTELGVLQNLLDETIGAKGRPEWARITVAQFSEWLGVTEKAVRNAIDSLETRKLIESRPAKDRREKEYRALIDNWSTTPERPARAASAAPEEEEQDVAADDETRTAVPVFAKLTVKAGGRQRTKLGETPYEFRNRTPMPINIHATGDQGRILIDFSGEYRNSSSAIAKSSLSSEPKPAAAASEHSHPGASHGRGHFSARTDRIDGLRDLLNPVFLKLFRRAPDDALLKRIDAELGDATLDQYGRVIDETRRKKRDARIETGLFVPLAQDARRVAEVEAAMARKKAAEEHAKEVDVARRILKPPAGEEEFWNGVYSEEEREWARQLLAAEGRSSP